MDVLVDTDGDSPVRTQSIDSLALNACPRPTLADRVSNSFFLCLLCVLRKCIPGLTKCVEESSDDLTQPKTPLGVP